MEELTKIIEWLFTAGVIMIGISSFVAMLSIKKGVKLSEVLLVPGWVMHSQMDKYIKPERRLFIKVTGTLGAFLFMLAVLCLVYKAIAR